MKIGTRVLLVNFGFMIIVAMMAGLSIFQIYTLDSVFKQSKLIGAAIRNQGEADMMHDGLRADVLFAIKLARDGNTAGREGAVASTQEHVENFNRLVKELEEMNVSPSVNEKLVALKEPMNRYTASALKLTGEAFTNLLTIEEGYKSFEEDFEYLEGALEQFSSVIEDEFNAVNHDVEEKEKTIKFMMVVAILFSFLVAGFGWYSMRRNVVKPVAQITDVMRAVSDGNLDVAVPYTGRRDEVGQMATTLQVFKENALETERIKAEQERLEIQNAADKKRMMIEMAKQFDNKVGGTIQSLAVAAEQLQSASKTMESTARSTQQASGSVVAAAEETSANVQTVAAATEKMTASSEEISQQVSNVAAKASEASSSANRTKEQVSKLNTLVSNIGEVVTAIKDIAEQTNLLALNATIEAARAGEAGKGFAVVADEVKKLATETSKKTEEIENRISQIQSATQASVNAVQVIIENVADIDGLSANAAGAVIEQNSTITEITRNINEVAAASREVSSIIIGVQQGANEAGESAETLRSAADNIARLSDSLDREVSQFLDQIRSDNQSAAQDKSGSDTPLRMAAE